MTTVGLLTDGLSGRHLELDVGRNVAMNLTPYAQFGTLDSLDDDLLRLASYVFAADLAVKRLEREQHIRSITLKIPIVNIHAFERVHQLVEQTLTTLSGDNWSVEFVPISRGSPAPNRPWPKKEQSTLLFSGGLDSFAGAIHLLNTAPTITLVSHVTHNWPVATAQSRLAQAVRDFTRKNVPHLQLRVFGRNQGGLAFPADQDREDSQRTRSFLFVALAAVAAHLNGSHRLVVMAENGQFAIHLPLSDARISSFSTHTANPKFLAEMQEILRQLLVCDDLEVVNPFVHWTKGEVVGLLPKGLHRHIKESSSCWRASRVPSNKTHCGECVPCLCRRIALEIHRLGIPEYQRDVLREPVGQLDADDPGKRNLLDLCQFVSLFAGPHRIAADQDLYLRFPELYDQHLNATEVIAMYRRFATEALNVFDAYPNVRALLT